MYFSSPKSISLASKIVVQAKRYSKSVGIDAVQQVHSSKVYYGVPSGK
ncbi:restriction endonuclease [Paenibacillus sp. XY044]|nr:restriction endonuclease [Paenibacillus sp. XY044]